MRILYKILIPILFLLAACGRQIPNSSNNVQVSAPAYEKKDFDFKTTFVVAPEPERKIVIDQSSTTSFSVASVDAKYGDCAGAILYNIFLKGANSSSIGVQSQVMPKLNSLYTYFSSNLSPTGQSPMIFTSGIVASSLDSITSTGLIFTIATSERLAFTFQVNYADGRKLNGTVDVPLTPGRQVQCK